MELCKECHKKPAESIRRKLCNTCYHRMRRNGQLKPIPEFVRVAHYLRNIRKKYSVEFFKDIKTIHSKHFYGLASVAEKYGVTREYVRQIHKLIYGTGFRIYQNTKAQEREESENMVCTNDPRRKVADYMEGGLHYKGAVAEKLFMKRCESFGLKVDISCLQTSDIIINGYRIDVKSSYTKPRRMGRGSKIRHFKFDILPGQREICDFFACYIPKKDCFYIIPNNEKGAFFKKNRSIYISEEKTDHYNSKNKYHEYKNLFSQLIISNTTADAVAEMRQPETVDV